MRSTWRKAVLYLGSAIGLMVSVAIVMLCPQMRAQTSNAQLSGLVTDSTGAVVTGAQIKAVNSATNVAYSSVSNEAGIYVLPELLPGSYTVSATAPGFGAVTHAGLVLNTGDHLAQNFTLKVGTVAVSVQVSGGQTLISSEEASSADVLDNTMITELPQLNRDSLDLTSTVPSVQGAGPQVDQVQTLAQQNSAYLVANTGNSYSLSGGQVNGAFVTVDGNLVQEEEFNNVNRAIPTPDAIGEFRVESGVLTADQGRYAGGIISMQTQSGGNVYHGRAFFYLRNEDLNSNDWTDNSLGNPRQDFQQKNYGVAGGGPVRIPHLYNGTDHTFFYAAWEGQRFSQGQVFESSIPTLLNQQGNFSQTVINYSNGAPVYANIYDPFYGTYDYNASDCANTPTGSAPCWVRPQFPNATIPTNYGNSVSCGTGLTCPVSGQSSLFAHYMALWPAPNHTPAANSDHVNDRYDQIQLHTPVDKYFLRVDEALRANHHIMGNLSRSMMTVYVPPPFKHAAESTTTDEDWLGAFLYTWTPGSRTVVNLRLGIGVTDLVSDGVSGDASLPDPNINTSTWGFDPLLASNNEKMTNEIPPVVNIGANVNSSAGGYTHVGGDQYDSFITQTDNGTVSVSRLLGRHTLKAGYEQYFTRFTEQGGDGTGVIDLNAGGGSNQYWNLNDGETGSQLAELMMGSSNFYSWGNWDITPFGWNQAAYIMDDWKVNTKLTVQIGLRWDHDGSRAGRHVPGSLLYDMKAKNVLTANSDWNWGQVTSDEPGLGSLPSPAWLSQGATGRVALLGTSQYPQKNLYTTNLVNLEPRLGLSWAIDSKTVLHASAGTVDQGLNGLSTDYMSFYYNTNTFNQIDTTDGMHWISELGSDHGLRSFPALPSGSNLGWVPPLTTNQQYWYATYGGSGNLDQQGTTINHYDTPTDYMWGLGLQRQVGNNWAVTAEYQGIRGIHLLTNVWNWSLNNVPLAYYQLGTHLNDQVPDPFYGQSQTFSAEPTVSLSQLMGLSPQYGGTTSTSPGETTWGKSFANYANFQIQSRNFRGLELLASYAIRKTLTNATSTDIHVGSPASGELQNPHNLMEGYGPALYELPQTLKVNYSYDLPFGEGKQWLSQTSGVGGHILNGVVGGWAFAGISTWEPKGTPVLVPTLDGGNTAPGAALRWGLVNDDYHRSGASYGNALVVNGAFANGNAQGVLNMSSFSRTPDYTLGNSPVMFRNLRNPGGFYTDASLLKRFYPTADTGRYLELRLEAENILNHPIFGSIIADPDSPTFGGINGKTGQRVMQAGLRIFF